MNLHKDLLVACRTCRGPRPATWLASEAHRDYRTIRRSLELGRSLESAPLVSAALVGWRIDLDKALIIIRALDGLPTEVPEELRDLAEAALVEQAGELSAKGLARVARHLETVVDPDAADAAESKALLREERSAWEKTTPRILDLGRAQRLFTPAQRNALRTRHSTCQVEGCDVPSTWCDAHHEDPWSTGGRTVLKNALLVCGHHHRRLHDNRYAATRAGDRVHLHLRT